MNDRNSLRPFRLRPIAKLRSPVIAVQQPPLTASLSTALSLALSLPLALHSLPQLSLPLSASLSLIFFFFLRSHSLPHSLFLSFTYLMSFNRTTLALAMSLRKCQANRFHAKLPDRQLYLALAGVHAAHLHLPLHLQLRAHLQHHVPRVSTHLLLL